MTAVPPSRYLVFLAIALGGCLADLLTKSWIFSRLGMPSGQRIWIWEGYFGFETSLNEGALFGIGQGMVVFFAVLSLAALIGIVYWLFVYGAALDWLLTIALGAMTAGILGNLYDRLGLHGLRWHHPPRLGEPVYAVRDWILIQVNDQLQWPNFNIADSLLVVGAGLILWHAFTTPDPAQAAKQEKPSSEPNTAPKA